MNKYNFSNSFLSFVILDKKYFRVPIGKPVLNSIAYVLDDEKMPVPLGEIGQLYISSKNLCDGYIGKNNNNFCSNKVCTFSKNFV